MTNTTTSGSTATRSGPSSPNEASPIKSGWCSGATMMQW
ncbi:unnamed protein product [Ectocarpus sp. 8 AP-2014]